MHENHVDIIVYMDDDDYYPPQRISHAVNMLMTHPNALCAGASEIYIWFKHIQKCIIWSMVKSCNSWYFCI